MVPKPLVTGATFITSTEARSGQGDWGDILRLLVLALEMSRAALLLLSPIHSPLSKEHTAHQDSPVPRLACWQSLHVGFYQVQQYWIWLPVAIFLLSLSFLYNFMCPRSLDIGRIRAAFLREDSLGEWPYIEAVMKSFVSSQLLLFNVAIEFWI